MIIVVQYGIESRQNFLDLQIDLDLQACAILLDFENYTRAYLFPIAVKIM